VNINFLALIFIGLEWSRYCTLGTLKLNEPAKVYARLLGGNPASIPVYASSMRRDISPEAEAERLLSPEREAMVIRPFKFRIGRECGHDQDQWPGRTEAIVKQVRETLGDSVALLVDANSAYTPAKAIEVGHMLQDYGICHFEEPCPYWKPGWTRQVRDALDIDISVGEQDNDMRVWRHMIDNQVVNILQPDVCYMGGVTRTLEVSEFAQQANLPVTLHSANYHL
jgi:L-alanine-DL-glutamate epimerase-like enolase superfamily enzyme